MNDLVTLTLAPTTAQTEADDGYPAFREALAARVANHRGPLFTTSADPAELWETFLARLPADKRQHYTCRCCRKFIETYGGLVTISEVTGEHWPLLWKPAVEMGPLFAVLASYLHEVVKTSRGTGVFLSSEPVWGTPENTSKQGPHAGTTWTHFFGRPAAPRTKSATKTDFQATAERKEEHDMLARGLAEYPRDLVAEALRVLRAEDALDRSEKTVGVAEWLLGLHDRLAGVKGRQRDNLVWAAVAAAPPGFCHVRSTMISTLLDDLKAGLPFDTVKRRWGEKMHPLKYQRPQAAPKAGAIDQAEKLFDQLGLAPALARRYARLDEVQTTHWLPPVLPAEAKPVGGIFSHLRPSEPVALGKTELPATTMTWVKFLATVLPAARVVECRLPARGPFFGLLTAADPAAPPLLQWDGLPGRPRNPVSWFFYHGGSTPADWGLGYGTWATVTAVFPKPCHWHEPERFARDGEAAFFALAGCKDRHPRELCLFPETLRSELHGVRSVLEAHSKRGKPADAELGTANGIAFQKGHPTPLTLRVTAADGTRTYNLDRWD